MPSKYLLYRMAPFNFYLIITGALKYKEHLNVTSQDEANLNCFMYCWLNL